MNFDKWDLENLGRENEIAKRQERHLRELVSSQIKELQEEWEATKDRYEHLGHFLELTRFNVNNNSNYTPEQLSYEELQLLLNKIQIVLKS